MSRLFYFRYLIKTIALQYFFLDHSKYISMSCMFRDIQFCVLCMQHTHIHSLYHKRAYSVNEELKRQNTLLFYTEYIVHDQ